MSEFLIIATVAVSTLVGVLMYLLLGTVRAAPRLSCEGGMIYGTPVANKGIKAVPNAIRTVPPP